MSPSPDLRRGASVDGLARLLAAERVIETHSSHVFLAGARAWKMRKPVHAAFADYRTVEARHRTCLAEIEVNRPLAPGVYLGAVPVTQAGDGTLGLGGADEVVDWLVEMKRLPADAMLDAILARGEIPDRAELADLAARLIALYRSSPAEPTERGLYQNTLCEQAAINAAHLGRFAELLGAQPGTLCRESLARIGQASAEISEREAAGLVVEGHGDLRPEHVCLAVPPVVFDRIEFSRVFRLIDPYDEAGYLAMESALIAPGAKDWLSPALQQAGFAPPSAQLLATYRLYRALTRARLSIDHLLDDRCEDRQKWIARTRRYLAVAELSLTAGEARVPPSARGRAPAGE